MVKWEALVELSWNYPAVKVYRQISVKQVVPSKRRAVNKAFMHLALIKNINVEDDVYTVSFVKKQHDGSYCWPEPDDISDVDRDDIVKMSSPNETIISGASSTVRVKLSFNKSDVNAARVALKVAVANVF